MTTNKSHEEGVIYEADATNVDLKKIDPTFGDLSSTTSTTVVDPVKTPSAIHFAHH